MWGEQYVPEAGPLLSAMLSPRPPVSSGCKHCSRVLRLWRLYEGRGRHATRTRGVICRNTRRTRGIICRHATRTWGISNYVGFLKSWFVILSNFWHCTAKTKQLFFHWHIIRALTVSVLFPCWWKTIRLSWSVFGQPWHLNHCCHKMNHNDG